MTAMQPAQISPVPDPLSQLKDIHLPDPVSFWPPAPGWWLLGILAIILSTWLALRVNSWYRNNAYRRQAEDKLAALDRSYNQHNDSTIYISNINNLLKQVAVYYYDKAKVSRLSGKQWLEFLDKSGNTSNFTRGDGQLLETAQYQKTVDIDVSGLKRCCRQWLKHHA